MGVINATINGAALPYSVVVRMVGETTGNRCTASCNNFPVTFDHDAGDNSYYFIVTDADGCVSDSRTVSGGISNINCDIVQPSFNAELIQPLCNPDGSFVPAVLKLTNITDGARYKICYNTVEMNCAPCTDSDGSITGSSIDISIPIATGSMGNRGMLIRVYKDNTCESYKEYFDTILIPVCTPSNIPDFSASILQPYCSSDGGGSVVNATVELANITDTIRYKICYNTNVFTCESGCASSDGTITGSTATINIPAPSAGSSQTNVIRFYSGAGCTGFKDLVVPISSPNCSSGQKTVAYIDFIHTNSGLICDNESTYTNMYDIYLTPNSPDTPSINGLKSLAGDTVERNIPNGNDVPNVYVSAPFKYSCTADTGGSIFKRFAINISNLIANFPSANLFSFDVYISRTKGTYTSNGFINITQSSSNGVRMIKQLFSRNSLDAFRDPENYNTQTTPCTPSCYANYNPSTSGFRKVGTWSYNKTTNQLDWIRV